MSTAPNQHEQTGEGNLHDLTDDEYFASLEEMPPVLDAEGNEITGLFADVVDARESKARAARAAEQQGGNA